LSFVSVHVYLREINRTTGSWCFSWSGKLPQLTVLTNSNFTFLIITVQKYLHCTNTAAHPHRLHDGVFS